MKYSMEGVMPRIRPLELSIVFLLTSATVTAASELRIDVSKCLNQKLSFGQPVGIAKGNTGTGLARIGLRLSDPAKGNTVWAGSKGGWIEVKLAVKGAQTVYTALNTYYGQSRITNATVRVEGSNGARAAYPLQGNIRIRDFNNWVWTNTINGTTTQVWWQTVQNPTPSDLSKRIDVQKLPLDAAFKTQRLTRIVVAAPADAAPNFMMPILYAITVVYTGQSTMTPVCIAHDP